jgi:hypothetical protein
VSAGGLLETWSRGSHKDYTLPLLAVIGIFLGVGSIRDVYRKVERLEARLSDQDPRN